MAYVSRPSSPQSSHITYLEANPSGSKTLFLLHGAAFSANDWRRIRTIHTMAALGYRVVAVNLRGKKEGDRGPRGEMNGQRKSPNLQGRVVIFVRAESESCV